MKLPSNLKSYLGVLTEDEALFLVMLFGFLGTLIGLYAVHSLFSPGWEILLAVAIIGLVWIFIILPQLVMGSSDQSL